MVAETPAAKDHAGLAALASRYVNVDNIPWVPLKWDSVEYSGVDMKVLVEDKETGLLTALVRFQPGAKLPLHTHTDIEQTFVLEGSLVDEEGACEAGQFVWRPAGNTHRAHSPNGALVLSIFLKPNKFLE